MSLSKNVDALAQRVGEVCKEINANIGDMSALETPVTTDLVQAINSIGTDVGGSGDAVKDFEDALNGQSTPVNPGDKTTYNVSLYMAEDGPAKEDIPNWPANTKVIQGYTYVFTRLTDSSKQYKFLHWIDRSTEKTYNPDAYITVNRNYNFTAVWQKIEVPEGGDKPTTFEPPAGTGTLSLTYGREAAANIDPDTLPFPKEGVTGIQPGTKVTLSNKIPQFTISNSEFSQYVVFVDGVKFLQPGDSFVMNEDVTVSIDKKAI